MTRRGASLLPPYFKQLGIDDSIMGALYKGLIAAGVLSVGGLFLATTFTVGWGEIGKANGEAIHGYGLFLSGVLGLIVTGAIVYITEYYTGTGKRPGGVDCSGVGDGPRHQRHPGPRRVA